MHMNQDTSLIRTLFLGPSIWGVPPLHPTNSLNLQTLEHKRGQPSAEEHRHHDDAERGGEDELPLGILRVADGQGEGNGPPQPRKHQHVLEAEADLLGASQVQEEGEHVDVDQTAGKDGHL